MVSPRPAKTPAERQRDLRARRRDDLAIFRLRLPRELVRDALLEEGEIGEWDDGDDSALQEALHRLILRTFRDVTP